MLVSSWKKSSIFLRTHCSVFISPQTVYIINPSIHIFLIPAVTKTFLVHGHTANHCTTSDIIKLEQITVDMLHFDAAAVKDL